MEDAAHAIREVVSSSNGTLSIMGMNGRQFIADKCIFDGFRRALCAQRDEAIACRPEAAYRS